MSTLAENVETGISATRWKVLSSNCLNVSPVEDERDPAADDAASANTGILDDWAEGLKCLTVEPGEFIDAAGKLFETDEATGIVIVIEASESEVADDGVVGSGEAVGTPKVGFGIGDRDLVGEIVGADWEHLTEEEDGKRSTGDLNGKMVVEEPAWVAVRPIGFPFVTCTGFLFEDGLAFEGTASLDEAAEGLREIEKPGS